MSLAFDTDDFSLQAKQGFQQLFTVRAKDKEGTPVFRESSKVTFRVTGPAEIVGVDNGDLCSSETYSNHWMHMYRGCVSTVIRLTGDKGRVILSAFSEGMYHSDLAINVV